jgi:hypothetical protein
MKKFEVLFTETVQYSVIVEAQNAEEAEEVVMNGNYDTSNVVDSWFDCVDGVNEFKDLYEEKTL